MQNSSQKSSRILWIDVARGIAIIAVIFGHTVQNPTNTNFFVNMLYLFHMPTFFFLSGYLYHQREAKRDVTVLTRSVLKPYIVTSLLVVVTWFGLKFIRTKYLFSPIKSLKELMVAIFYGAGLPPINPFGWHIFPIGAIWFLLAFFFGKLIFDFIMRVVNNDLYRGTIFLGLMVFGAWVMKFWALPWAGNAAMMSLPYFFIGYLFKKYQILSKITKWMSVGFVFYWILTAAKFPTYVVVWPQLSNLWIQVPVSIMAILVVCKVSQWLERKFKRLPKILAWYGAGSLIILCFHLIQLQFDNSFQVLMGKFHLNPALLGIGLLWSLYRVIFPTLMLWLVSKVRWLHNLFFPIQKA